MAVVYLTFFVHCQKTNMCQVKKTPGSKKRVCYKILHKNRQVHLQVTFALGPSEITFGFSPWVCPSVFIQQIKLPACCRISILF